MKFSGIEIMWIRAKLGTFPGFALPKVLVGGRVAKMPQPQPIAAIASSDSCEPASFELKPGMFAKSTPVTWTPSLGLYFT